MFTKLFFLAACSAIVAIVFAQPNSTCTGDGCNKDCEVPALGCAIACVGDECGAECEGSTCAAFCKGDDCGKWCGVDTEPVCEANFALDPLLGCPLGGFNCAGK